MLETSEISRVLSAVRFADILDILVVAAILYLVAKWLLHRASWAVAVGLTLVLALNLMAQVLSMYLTLAVFRVGAVLIVVIFAIVFQDDIRRGVERLAAWRPGRLASGLRPRNDIRETLVEAVNAMAERRLGALIVLAGRQPLEAHVRGGVPLHGEPSFPLFLSLFDDRTPGHDGAVILDGSLVTRFGVHLPLSKNLDELGSGGTRHAAALGLSEWCDALIIVVSEERGTISVAEGGKLTELESAAQLSKRLEAFYSQQEHGLADTKRGDRVAGWSLKAASLLAACLLWGTFAYRVDRVERVFDDVAVEYRSLPKGWQVEQIEPAAVQLTLSGPERAFDQLDPASLQVSLDLDEYPVRLGRQRIRVSQDDVELPRGVRLAPGDPPVIELVLEQVVTADVPVQPVFAGEPPESHRIARVTVSPAELTVSLPSRLRPRVRSLQTEPIELDGVSRTFTREVKILLPPDVAPSGEQEPRAKVTVEIERAAAEAAD